MCINVKTTCQILAMPISNQSNPHTNWKEERYATYHLPSFSHLRASSSMAVWVRSFTFLSKINPALMANSNSWPRINFCNALCQNTIDHEASTKACHNDFIVNRWLILNHVSSIIHEDVWPDSDDIIVLLCTYECIRYLAVIHSQMAARSQYWGPISHLPLSKTITCLLQQPTGQHSNTSQSVGKSGDVFNSFSVMRSINMS